MKTNKMIFLPGIGQAIRNRIFSGVAVFLLFYSPLIVALWGYISNISIKNEYLYAGITAIVTGLCWHLFFLFKELSDNIMTLEGSKEDLYEKGRVASLRGNYDLAKFYFENLLKQNSDDEDAAYQLGIVYQETGEHRKTEKLYRRFVSSSAKKWQNEMTDYLEGLKK